ncbi:MAG: ComEC/Rec2 family competence protein [Chitinophagaceae bacterium]|nr:ComEC/Rec2 family competence protein [Chitinophagaceae bacterium]
MKKFDLPFWKDAPMIRVVLSFIAGILLNHYCQPHIGFFISTLAATLIAISYFPKLKLKWQYHFNFLRGLLVNSLILSAGALIAFVKNPFINQDAISESTRAIYVASIEEPPLKKKSSWKAQSVVSVITSDADISREQNILIYFRNDSIRPPPVYGSRIGFRKNPEPIKNFVANSPFDYKKYCALKNIHYQVFLGPSEYVVLEGSDKNAVKDFLFRTQQWVINVLHKNIRGKKECGLAEALLIGYKNDLDKDLIQSYSNTGVVHVVAISGLHLGLIYGILNMFCRPLGSRRTGRILRPIAILLGLWMFSLLAGGSPSVIRSAVMFSSVVIAQSVSRSSSLLNNLATSAFFLLCYDPYWLWDLGFILSYAALLSITLFGKQMYALYIPDNKLLDGIWKLNAVTLSAQILTMPVLLYYFGQFPTLFMVTNSIAIPLSGIILIGEIVLCGIYFIEPVARATGVILEMLIRLMNSLVEYLDSFPFSSIRGIDINLLQVILIYVIIFFAARNGHKFQLK